MTTTTTRRVPLKSVALPNEHGAWGFWLERGEKADQLTPLVSSIVACSIVSLLVYTKLLPALVLPVMVVLFIRAAFGLSIMRRKAKARTVGMLELAYGLLVVMAVFLGNTLSM
jgi:hypothetical protein